ncbi:Hypothetical protein, putative [Bodo saltans]|uniref:Uncharacterized protein n=1 Tax=Bodo saltans TaxID=75058 RepID=A0A0S4JDF5_BODSA|nr:Hypothetical protein, putative [Bodo saltans]|eukprot:CUG88011.1 Hypothetical protein, putative [Bodo saltans]
MSAPPRRNTNSGRGGGPQPPARGASSSVAESIDAHLIEPVPPSLKKFHPGKGAILVRKIEIVSSQASQQALRPTPIEAIANAVLGTKSSNAARSSSPSATPAPSTNERVLALGPKGLYVSDPNGTVLRVMVYEDIQKLSIFQKYIHITFSTREDNEAHELLMSLSPFPDNSRNNPRDISDAIMRKCGKNLVIDEPTVEALGLSPARNKALCPSAASSSVSSPLGNTNNNRMGESFSASPMMSLAGDVSFATASASNASMVLLAPFDDYGPGEWARVVEELYRQNMPSKLREVPALLKKFAGQEQNLVLGIVKKYNVANPANVIASACGRAITGTTSVAPQQATASSPPSAIVVEESVSASPEGTRSAPLQSSPIPSTRPSPKDQPLRGRPLEVADDGGDEAIKFQRALEHASNATDDFAIQQRRSHENLETLNNDPDDLYSRPVDDDDEPSPVYDEWNASQWADHLESRVAAAAVPSSGRPLHPEDDYEVNPEPQHTYDPTEVARDMEQDDEDEVDARGGGRSILPDDNVTVEDVSYLPLDRSPSSTAQHDYYSPAFDLSSIQPAAAVVVDPSLTYAHQLLAEENPSIERYNVARLIHLPSLERRDHSVEGEFETMDQPPPSSRMDVYKPFETRSGSPDLLVSRRPLQELAAPVRHHAHTVLPNRRLFGGGNSGGVRVGAMPPSFHDATYSPAAKEVSPESSYLNPPRHLAVDGDEPIEAESFPAWETAEKPAGGATAAAMLNNSPDAVTTTPPSAVATKTNVLSAIPPSFGGGSPQQRQEITSTFSFPTRLSTVTRDSVLDILKGPGSSSSSTRKGNHLSPALQKTSALLPNNTSSTGSSLLSATTRKDGLDWDESSPTASPALQHRNVGRYFLSANATEALRLLRPEHAITLPSPGSHNVSVEELISIAVGILKQNRGSSNNTTVAKSTTTQVSVAAARLYQTWSVDVQAKCFHALQAFLGDEWNCSAFLNALAPLVDFRFDSVVLTLKGNGGGDASPTAEHLDEAHSSAPHQRRARVQMHCPQVLFDAFVAAWDSRSRHVLRVTSRHGCMSLNDVSADFLEFIDRYSAYAGNNGGGDGGGNAPSIAALSRAAVTSPLGPAARRTSMEFDVSHPQYSATSMFAKERTVPATDFSSLWARGNVLLRVHNIPFHGSAAKDMQLIINDANFEVDYGNSHQSHDDGSGLPSSSIAGGTTSLPLTEWNDLVSRWNSAFADKAAR